MMKQAFSLVIIIITYFLTCEINAEDDPSYLLQQARNEMSKNNFSKANDYYNQIKFDPNLPSSVWTDKILDAIRYQLINKSATQAMQLISVLQHLNLETDLSSDYKQLSLFIMDVCPLSQSSTTLWQSLIQAAYYLRLAYVNNSHAPYSDSFLPTHSALTLKNHFSIGEISQFEWIAGQGCRHFKTTTNPTQHYLTKALELYKKIRLDSSLKIVDQEMLYMIDLLIFHTQHTLKHDDKERHLEKVVFNIPLELWSKVPFPLAEKNYEWLKIDAKEPSQSSHLEKIALHMVKTVNERRIPFWFNQLPFFTWSVANQIELLEFITLKYSSTQTESMSLYLAELYNKQGQYQKSLKSLVEVINSEDETIRSQATEFLNNLIDKYLFDDRFYGALTILIPPSSYQEKLTEVALHQAFAGEKVGFQRVINALQSGFLKNDYNTQFAKSLFTSVLNRNYPAFKRQVAESNSLGILKVVYIKGLTITDSEFSEWKPYMESIHLRFTRQHQAFFIDKVLHSAMKSRLGGLQQEGLEAIKGKTSYMGKMVLNDKTAPINAFFKATTIPDTLVEAIIFMPSHSTSNVHTWQWGRL